MTHIEEMQNELKELREKMDELEVFLQDETFDGKKTDEIQRVNIARQIEHMAGYASVLEERIIYDWRFGGGHK